jgi:uncharacterized protein with PIN domain
MAASAPMLVSCPACKHACSEAAQACPQCGHPLARISDPIISTKVGTGGRFRTTKRLALVSACSIFLALYLGSANQ